MIEQPSVVHLHLNLAAIARDRIGYKVTGTAEGAVTPFPPGQFAEGTFVPDLNGMVDADSSNEWIGFQCALAINPLGVAYDDELTPAGFIGDGWADAQNRTVNLRFNLNPTIVREIIEFWLLLSRDREDSLPLRCDIVIAQNDRLTAKTVSFRVLRMLTFGRGRNLLISF